MIKTIYEMDNNTPNKEPTITDLISLAEASELSGLSHGHLALLIRKGQLWGIKLGRNWVTTKKAVEAYLASNPHPGPKGRG